MIERGIEDRIKQASEDELVEAEKAIAERRASLREERKKAFRDRHPKDGTPSLAMGVTYSSTSRCPCGGGLVHENDREFLLDGSWACDRVFFLPKDEWEALVPVKEKSKGFQAVARDPKGVEHHFFPFTFYEIKSEFQPSAEGMTTRPGPFVPDAKAFGELVCSICGLRLERQADHRMVLEHAATH